VIYHEKHGIKCEPIAKCCLLSAICYVEICAMWCERKHYPIRDNVCLSHA
jgi:hypothetical protein